MLQLDLDHTFVTSDHHFGSWQLPKPFAVFSQAEEKELINKWNQVVGKDDIVLYNGDFHDCSVMMLFDYVSKLNGQIVLVKGNHDNLPDELYKAVFKDVVESLTVNGILIHHCPKKRCSQKEIYGHVHRCELEDFKRDKSFCSCVQFNDGYPVKLASIIEELR